MMGDTPVIAAVRGRWCCSRTGNDTKPPSDRRTDAGTTPAAGNRADHGSTARANHTYDYRLFSHSLSG